jgi:glycerophosphoryl diester phosphodiesterase
VSVWRGAAPFVVGHRGGRGEGWPPENTLEAFERARMEGALAIELDVRTSADGVAVVFHDPTLSSMTGARDTRAVDRVPLAELRTIDLGGGARIPTLADVLVWAIACGIGVNVELKHDVPDRGDVARATALAVRAGPADILFSSFDPLLLALIARRVGSAPRAFLTHSGQSLWAGLLQEAVRPPIVDALHVQRTQVDAHVDAAGGVSTSALLRYTRRGLRVGVWTVNDPAEGVAFVRQGAAWIITDRPGAVREALREPVSRT